MFYRLENNKPVESFDTQPVFHPDLMVDIIESATPPGEYDVWDGTQFVSEYTDAELLQMAKKKRYLDVKVYAQNLIDSAYANPTQGVTADPQIHKEKMNIRRNQKADKLAGEIALTQAEKDEAKTDQKLSEYEYKIWDDADKAITNIDKLNTVQEIEDFDISTQSWNVWTPPV